MSVANIQLRIEKIEIKSFSMTKEALNFTANNTYTVEFGFGVSLPDKNGKVSFNLDMAADREENGYIGRLATIKTLSTFFVKDHDQFIIAGPNDKAQVDGALVKILMELCMHQLRGIWAAKTEGTPIESVIVPLLNIDTLVQRSKERASGEQI